jgi:hypothetical protein
MKLSKIRLNSLTLNFTFFAGASILLTYLLVKSPYKTDEEKISFYVRARLLMFRSFDYYHFSSSGFMFTIGTEATKRENHFTNT